jgi:hypothetical protein
MRLMAMFRPLEMVFVEIGTPVTGHCILHIKFSDCLSAQHSAVTARPWSLRQVIITSTKRIASGVPTVELIGNLESGHPQLHKASLALSLSVHEQILTVLLPFSRAIAAKTQSSGKSLQGLPANTIRINAEHS